MQAKNIIVGITGGIAAYKSAELVRLLRKQGANVRVVMTASAKEFITPMTLQALSGNPVHHELFDPNMEAAMGHIELARWADLILIAPASCNFLARLANGMADDLLTTLCMATAAPIASAPAMNRLMWENSATRANIELLKQRGVTVWGPGEGSQACGEEGLGRMLEASELADLVFNQSQEQNLQGKKILITAGPTQEAIDPVRYISNHSSGKMGYAIASAALEQGAEVILISGPTNLTPPAKLKYVSVSSAMEMYTAVMANLDSCDIFIGAAAVADYRVDEPAKQKVKKTSEHKQLALVPNPDIIATVAANPTRPFMVGFAAETESAVANARQKLQTKNLDVIAANVVATADTGFNVDTNELVVLWEQGEKHLPLANKQVIAEQLLNIVIKEYKNAQSYTS